MKYLPVYLSIPLLVAALTVTGDLNAAETDDSKAATTSDSKAEKSSDSKATNKGGSKPRWYVGGSYGQALYEDVCDSVSGTAGATCDDKGDSYKIFVGSRVSPNLAFEAAYVDLGEATASNPVFGGGTNVRTIEVTGLNFSVLGIKPLSKSFDLFGKFGLMLWEADGTTTDNLGSSTASVGDSDINFGFGANYNVNETFTLRAEYERFHNISYDSNLETPVSLLTLGVVVSF
jgi:OOP family OmpA-OmpF porin